METRADKRKYHYIYKITRFDGKFYIGLHSTDNLEDGYFGSGARITNSVKYHGRDKHTFEILEFLPSRAALKIREREIVNEEFLKLTECLNLTLGGGGGDFSESTCEKISKSRKGVPNTPEQRARISEALKGKKKPEGFGEKVSRGLAGRKLTEEHKEKVRAAQIGRKLSSEHVAAQTAGKIGKRHSEERNKRKGERMKGKPNLSGAKLHKRCTVDDVTIYPSVTEFVKALGNGKKGIKHPNFKFLED